MTVVSKQMSHQSCCPRDFNAEAARYEMTGADETGNQRGQDITLSTHNIILIIENKISSSY